MNLVLCLLSEHKALADEYDPPMQFFETSAKLNVNAPECLHDGFCRASNVPLQNIMYCVSLASMVLVVLHHVSLGQATLRIDAMQIAAGRAWWQQYPWGRSASLLSRSASL